MVSCEGLEPTTLSLKGKYSTTELAGLVLRFITLIYFLLKLKIQTTNRTNNSNKLRITIIKTLLIQNNQLGNHSYFLLSKCKDITNKLIILLTTAKKSN